MVVSEAMKDDASMLVSAAERDVVARRGRWQGRNRLSRCRRLAVLSRGYPIKPIVMVEALEINWRTLL